ncbi:MAG: succinyl-diaminopimelate desuccinylase, partial [Sphingomonadales bacterium]|nr:succinyl-diaminopimelate desuccinylase [Sphingomonadales bacterium]
RDGMLYGRGAADMKSAIAAFVAAAARHLADHAGPATGSLSLLITADEEGPAINGTRKMLQWLAERGEKIDFCLVGEPTNPASLGEMIKIGRRGSLTGYLTVKGVAGHVAYPHRAENPIPGLFEILGALTGAPLDDGTEEFEPSNIEVTTVDVGNPAVNVIPAAAHATFNIRFNDRHTPESLEKEIRARCDAAEVAYELEILVSGEAFVSDHHAMLDALVAAIRERTGSNPILSTTGGTSDARFIKDYCPVAEFGLVGATMHKVNEHVDLSDIAALEDIYFGVIRRMLA